MGKGELIKKLYRYYYNFMQLVMCINYFIYVILYCNNINFLYIYFL